MKRFFLILTLIVLVVFISSCAEQTKENSSMEEESLESISGEASSEDLSLEAPKLPSDYDLSYEEYFSKERKRTDLSLVCQGYFFHIGYKGQFYRYRSEKRVPSHGEREYELLFSDGVVNGYTIARNRVYFMADGKRIYSAAYYGSFSGDDIEMIYEFQEPLSGDITDFFADDALLWFRAGPTVYRLHLSSGTLDEVYTNEEMILARPLSNYSIEYDVYKPEYLDFLANGGDPENGWLGSETTTYIYNSHTGENYEAQYYEDDPYTIIYEIEQTQ
ncbi:MAG: hypothetical protein ACI4IT_01605 [Oscillospiraceae bacterium]